MKEKIPVSSSEQGSKALFPEKEEDVVFDVTDPVNDRAFEEQFQDGKVKPAN